MHYAKNYRDHISARKFPDLIRELNLSNGISVCIRISMCVRECCVKIGIGYPSLNSFLILRCQVAVKQVLFVLLHAPH